MVASLPCNLPFGYSTHTPLTRQRKRGAFGDVWKDTTHPSIPPLPLEELVSLLQAWLQARLPAPERKPGRPRTFSDLSLLLFRHPERAEPEAALAPPAGREAGGPEKADPGHGSRAKPVPCLHPPPRPEVGWGGGLGRGLGWGLGLRVQAPPALGPGHGGGAEGWRGFLGIGRLWWWRMRPMRGRPTFGWRGGEGWFC